MAWWIPILLLARVAHVDLAGHGGPAVLVEAVQW